MDFLVCRVPMWALVLTACASTTVLPVGDDGGAADTGAPDTGAPDTGAPGMDAGPDMPPPPEPLTLRVTDAELQALEAEVWVATDSGVRIAFADRVTLSSEELVARADLVVAAPGFPPLALSRFRRADYAALPEVEGTPAIALVPSLLTDALEVEVPASSVLISTDPIGYGGGFAGTGRRARVQRDPAVRALLVEGESECPRRLPVPDLTTVRSPFVIDLDTMEFEELDCVERTVEVVAPEGAELTQVASGFQAPARGVAFGYGPSGSNTRFAGQAAFFTGAPSNTRSLFTRLLPEAIALRDHPAMDPERRCSCRPAMGWQARAPRPP